LSIYDFGQKRLNGGADWSAAEDGQVLPHFQQTVKYWGINAAVPYGGCILIPLRPVTGRSVGQSVGWSVGHK
jgi:hypothetical protein